MTVGMRLINLRKDKKLSAQDVADYLGCTRQLIYAYEKDKSIPSGDNLSKLAIFYGVTTEFLMSGKKSNNMIFYKIPAYNSLLSLKSGSPDDYFITSETHLDGSFWWQVSDGLMCGKYSEHHQFLQGSYVLVYPSSQEPNNGDYILIKDKKTGNISIRYYLAEYGIALYMVGDNRFAELNSNPRDADIIGIIKEHRIKF